MLHDYQYVVEKVYPRDSGEISQWKNDSMGFFLYNDPL